MKHIHPSSRSLTPPALQGMALGLLVSGFLACRVFAAGDDIPVLKDANGVAPLAALPATSGSNSSPITVPNGVSVSAGDLGPAVDPDSVIGQSGKIAITVKDLRAALKNLDPGERAAISADPAVLKRTLLSLLVERMVMEEITSKQWGRQSDVQERLERVRQITLTELYLTSVANPPDDFPGDAELKSAYEARKATFNVPHELLISQIFVALNPADKTQAKMDAIYKRLQQPDADFGAIAHDQSDDAKGAAHNGEMGWVSEEKLPSRIRAQALVLPKNSVSNPIRLDDGWHIIKVLDARDIRPLGFEDVKAGLAQQLRAERAKADRQAYLDKLLQQHPVTIDDKVLSKAMGGADK